MTRIVIDEGGFDALLAGPVADDMAERGERVAAAQRANIHSISGELAESVEAREPKVLGDDVVVDVGSSLYYAAYVNSGTAHADPHPFVEPSAEAAG